MKLRSLGALLALVLVTAGCGSPSRTTASTSPSADSSTTASASPSPLPTLPDASPPSAAIESAALYIVIASPTFVGPTPQWSIQVSDLQGKIVAKAAFTGVDRNFPNGPAPQPEVRVAGGAVFYSDGSGTVHRLAVGGTITQVASLTLTDQVGLSYAVSPDGTQLIATVAGTAADGHRVLRIERGPVGGALTTVRTLDWGGASSPLAISGWDYAGPVAVLTTVPLEQSPSYAYTGSELVHLGSDGAPVDRIGGAGCVPIDEQVDGTVLCRVNDANGTPAGFNVHSPDGTNLWGRYFGYTNAFEPKLSPDGSSVAWGDSIYSKDSPSPASWTRYGTTNQLLGWAGNGSVVVCLTSSQLGLSFARDPLVFMGIGISVYPNSCGSGYIHPYGMGTYLAGTIAAP